MNSEITHDHIKQVLVIFQTTSYEAGNCDNETNEYTILRKCEELYKLDYNLIELDNLKGALCTRYPSRMFVPESEKNHMSFLHKYDCIDPSNPIDPNKNLPSNSSSSQKSPPTPPSINQQHQNVIYEDLCDATKIREIITMAKYARCRQRFIIPVIMFRGKYICRSATISVMPETYGRKVFDYAYDCFGSKQPNQVLEEDIRDDQSYESIITSTEPSPFSYDEVIKSDIQLLNTLNITTIFDLMMENRKIKYFMAVSSSEKADPENHYEPFNIFSLPYPGCEFFKNFRDNNYMAKNLLFDWTQSFIDAKLNIPKNSIIYDMDINWLDYQNWDLVLITQNYLKAILKYIQDENSGLLIHCISGWDRTPLFISLVRLSLWADGLIHQSLSAIQITYLTLAYDWYLFGHQLPDRISRGEDILFFCFHFLKHISDDEFAVREHRKRTKTTSSSSSGGLVFKNDHFDDDFKDEPIAEEELTCCQDTNDSLLNLEVTNANDNIIPNITKNRSPNSKRNKTSPISVPGVSRQRHDSTSSNSSWQMINGTGSIESVKTCSHMRCLLPDEPNGVVKPIISLRKQRLNTVRTIFVQAYGKNVGLKFQEGSGLNISNIIEAISDQLF